MLYSLPRVDPDRYFTDKQGVKRISPQGLVLLFSKRFPGLNPQIVKEQLEKIESQLDWIPGRCQLTPEGARYTHFAVIKMYSAGKQTTDLLNQALLQYFATHSG